MSTVSYACMMLAAGLYIVALWGQVYLDTRKADEIGRDLVSESHRHWRLRTSLLFLIWSVLGGLTLLLGFGWLIIIPAYAWYLYRVAKGFLYFRLGRPVGLVRAITSPGRLD